MTEAKAGPVSEDRLKDEPDALVLDSDLAAMARLPEWVDGVAARHGLPEKTLFAAKLCLEETVSNSIRHGYGMTPGSEVRVRFDGLVDGRWEFSVEDDAPHFDPLAQAELPAISLDTFELGGQGLRLMRAFATSLAYEQTESGNRMTIGFAPPEDPAREPAVSA